MGLFGKPLSEDELKEKKEQITRAAELKMHRNERIAAVNLAKFERKIRHYTYFLKKDLDKTGKILGNLHQAIAKKDVDEIIGTFFKKLRFNSNLKNLEKLKVKIGGYLGIISSILAETLNFKEYLEEKKELQIKHNELLKIAKELEENISEITSGINVLETEKKFPLTVWDDILRAVEKCSILLTTTHDLALGSQALERNIRNKLKRN